MRHTPARPSHRNAPITAARLSAQRPTAVRLAWLAVPLLLAAAWCIPSYAASMAASSASTSLTTSSASISTSIEGISGSSSRATGVAAGDYRITEVAAVAEQPGMVRLKLKAVTEGTASDAFALVLPAKTLNLRGLTQGELITARERPYGLEFSETRNQQAFFLVLHDDWHQEMPTRAVTL
ncbi:hypothetical protein [Ideonella sp.]|uniref:hypothetical protein n=1 Tax=Ideonella sp. TaxID=1929293 RepID=UPI003BB7ADC5